MTDNKRQGPLAGVRIVEMAGIGSGPVTTMLLADMGATVIRVDRKTPSGLGAPRPWALDLVARGRNAIRVDLKDKAGVDLVLRLIDRADALIEGFRPGVMERMGLGPEVCLKRNPRLVFGRVTGWGQDGPLRDVVGHDNSYTAVNGLLSAIGRAGSPPLSPLGMIGDYAGGSLSMAYGLMAALYEARRSGLGQVVDASVMDGVATLMTNYVGLRQAGVVSAERGTNLMDSGAPFYDVHRCADGGYVAVGAVSDAAYGALLTGLGLGDPALADRARPNWPALRQALAAAFATRSRDDWAAHFAGSPANVTPVLTVAEAFQHPHLRERHTFVEVAGTMHAGPGPKFSRTPLAPPPAPSEPTHENARAAIGDWLDATEVEALAAASTFV
ncbi:MAG: CoA transferase [Rhodobacteraceae bacterium]|nr:CoA transferase [Paracoccaceae bacterium]